MVNMGHQKRPDYLRVSRVLRFKFVAVLIFFHIPLDLRELFDDVERVVRVDGDDDGDIES